MEGHLQGIVGVVDLPKSCKILQDAPIDGILGPLARSHHQQAEAIVPVMQLLCCKHDLQPMHNKKQITEHSSRFPEIEVVNKVQLRLLSSIDIQEARHRSSDVSVCASL